LGRRMTSAMASSSFDSGSATLETRLDALVAENRSCAQRYRACQQYNRELVAVAIASNKLHEARSRGEVLGSIETMFANLLGVTDLAVMEIEGSELRLLTALGAGARLGRIRLDGGPIAHAAATSRPYIADARRTMRPTVLDVGFGLDMELAALLPLWVGGCVIAMVIAVRPCGGQREPPDAELVAQLSRQAALALWSAALEPPPSARTTRRMA
jgi:hypothetical protein